MYTRVMRTKNITSYATFNAKQQFKLHNLINFNAMTERENNVISII